MPDIVCLSEHSLQEHLIVNTRIMNYSLVSSYCRQERKGGGVAIWSRDMIDCKQLNCEPFCVEGVSEFAAATLDLGESHSVLVLAVYRPPSSMCDSFLDQISGVLNKLLRNHSSVFVVGDLNIDLSRNCLAASRLIYTMSTYGLSNVVKGFTREALGCQSLIDHVFTNNLQVTCSVISTALSDHYAQSVSLRFNSGSKTRVARMRETRVFDKANMLTFKSLLAKEDWSEMFSACDMDSKYKAFIAQLKYYFDYAFPSTRKRYGSTSSPLKIKLTDEILRLKTEVLSLNHKTRHLSSDHFLRHYYRRMKYRYRKAIREQKSKYVLQKIEQSDNKTKMIWGIINKNREQKNKTTNNIALKINDKLIKCPKEVANIFNSYFINAGKETLASNCHFAANNGARKTPRSSLFLNPVSSNELKKIVLGLKNKKSSGFDQLPATVLKYVVDEICQPLCYLVNFSFTMGHFPKELKMAVVKPVFKKGCLTNCDNYRPIAILSTISKIFELAALDRLQSFMEKHNTLSDCQHGFVKKRNTTSAIFSLLRHVTSELDSGRHVSGIFFDLRKAFDTVNHDLLCRKMFEMGVRGLGLDWISSYLRGRSQVVEFATADRAGCLRRQFSSEASISMGVPQGSILGPILFILFVNNLSDSVQSANVCQYADDTSLSISSPCSQKLEQSSFIESNSLHQWLSENHLSLSANKTQLVNFSISNTSSLGSKFTIMLDESPISPSESVKFLGMVVDERLKFYHHIDYVANKVSIGIFIMRSLAKTVQADVLLTAYYGLVYPFLVYTVPIWGHESQRTAFLFKLQKKAIRVIFSLKHHQSCRDFFRTAKILTFPCIYILELLTFVKLNISLFTLSKECVYALRGSFNLRLPKHKTSFFKKHTVYSGITLFNCLPTSLKTEMDLSKFRRKLKAVLLELCCYSVQEFRAANPFGEQVINMT